MSLVRWTVATSAILNAALDHTDQGMLENDEQVYVHQCRAEDIAVQVPELLTGSSWRLPVLEASPHPQSPLHDNRLA